MWAPANILPGNPENLPSDLSADIHLGFKEFLQNDDGNMRVNQNNPSGFITGVSSGLPSGFSVGVL